jgi:hypothetical protein
MMSYSKESKAYQPFHPIKQKFIIKRNVWFDEKSSGMKLLNASSIFIQDDCFDVVSNYGSPVPFFSPSNGRSNFVPLSTKSSTFESIHPLISISNGPPSPSTEIDLLIIDLLQ